MPFIYRLLSLTWSLAPNVHAHTYTHMLSYYPCKDLLLTIINPAIQCCATSNPIFNLPIPPSLNIQTRFKRSDIRYIWTFGTHQKRKKYNLTPTPTHIAKQGLSKVDQ